MFVNLIYVYNIFVRLDGRNISYLKCVSITVIYFEIIMEIGYPKEVRSLWRKLMANISCLTHFLDYLETEKLYRDTSFIKFLSSGCTKIQYIYNW